MWRSRSFGWGVTRCCRRRMCAPFTSLSWSMCEEMYVHWVGVWGLFFGGVLLWRVLVGDYFKCEWVLLLYLHAIDHPEAAFTHSNMTDKTTIIYNQSCSSHLIKSIQFIKLINFEVFYKKLKFNLSIYSIDRLIIT